jgi:shikimate kinase
MHLVEPTRAGALSKTQHNAALVQALFGEFCAALSHPSAAKGLVRCPAEYGISYTGTFYDGTRTLATFIYGASGCQIVSLTADGQTRTTMVLGTASTAAPQLRADMAAVLEVPRLAIAQPVSGAGTNK